MAGKSLELQEALRRLARATTTHERKMATQEVNLIRYPGLDPQPGRKGGSEHDYDRFYGRRNRDPRYDDEYPRRHSRRFL